MKYLDYSQVVSSNLTMPEGTKVLVLFVQSIQFKGIVKDSRVMYGGRRQYTIETLEAIQTPWGSSRKVGETVLVEANSIVAILE